HAEGERAEPASSGGAEKIRDGARHAALKRRLVALRHKGLSPAELLGAGLGFNRDRCEPPKPDEEVEKLVGWIVKNVPGDDASPPPIEVCTQEEFKGDELPEAIVEGLLHQASSTNLNGGSKAGKSYLALQMGMCIATGTSFLGLAVRQTTVVYCC